MLELSQQEQTKELVLYNFLGNGAVIAVGGITGGLGAWLGDGNFAEGATAGAFVTMFNFLQHEGEGDGNQQQQPQP